MPLNFHKDAPYNELHNAKIRTGTRPPAPEGLGDAHWNATAGELSLSNAAGTDWLVLKERRMTILRLSASLTGTQNPIPWSIEDVDTLNAWVSGSPTQINAPAGQYLVKLSVQINLSGGGTCSVTLQPGGYSFNVAASGWFHQTLYVTHTGLSPFGLTVTFSVGTNTVVASNNQVNTFMSVERLA